ncbi:hypothetical protein Hdeb2414_s0001g00022151 [Helianthus debilis subsp. tardiflorus]
MANRRPVLRSHSPSGRFHTSPSSNSFASSTSSFSSSTSFFNRSVAPTHVNLYVTSSSPSPSVRFSSNRSISVTPTNNNSLAKKPLQAPKLMCICSPTSHPGSFRCSLHKNINNLHNNTTSYPNNRLNAWRRR